MTKAPSERAITVGLTDDLLDELAERVMARLSLTPERGLYDVTGACEYLSVPESRLYELIRDKKLIPRKIGRRNMFTQDELRGFVDTLA